MLNINKNFFWLTIVILLTIFACSPSQLSLDDQANIEKDNILKYPIHQKTSSNGLQIVTVPFDSPGLVSFYIVVRVGSRNEVEEGVTGFAHFFEHMMFRGTEKYPREKYKTLLNFQNVSKADLNKGRYVFDGLCAACHKMYDSGGILGPELTGANRTDIDYLLNNVMDPSGIIQDDYKMVMITTRDGRTYAGNIANQNERSIVLCVVGQDAVVISKSDIQSIDSSELSMMPEGMLDDMSTSEVLDLFSYLMLSTSQVEPSLE